MNLRSHINPSTPNVRSVVRKLEKNKVVVENKNLIPISEDGFSEETFSIEESFEKLWGKMEEHYGFDLRTL
jgi:hypothetical protein